jgi:lipopolysaccharide/colanic/teichoic acid biosynthesis glycosyltransferase
MRCDRGHSNFSRLTLTLSPRSDQAEVSALAHVLSGRIRATDDAGFIEPRCLGILLPETPAAGARKLAEDIRDLLPAEIHHLKCDVYTYPSDDEPHEPPTNGSLARNGSMAGNLVVPRVIDIMGAAVGLVLVSPILLLAALAIKLTSPGPILFKQDRHTIGGRRFLMYKFRTMSVDAERLKAQLRKYSEQDGPAFKIAKDPRITPIGRVLRATSIDELPQLWNVLKGDMSLVGPRPLPCDESAACSGWQKRRLNVTPGLTCIWQVKGRSEVTFDEWMRMDLEYIQSRSFVKDLTILAHTMPAVLFGDGAY